ncbi:MAG: GMC family oxidoreductase, partial [Sphingomonadaceae bacterium]
RVLLDTAQDRLGMPRAKVDWRIRPDDRRALDRLIDLLKVEMPRADLGRIVPDTSPDAAGWPASMSGGKHHMGTTRMHDDPAQGVTDGSGKVHGMANLYVAGSSLFPTAGYANPTLTIVALALRSADHLRRLF